MADGAGVVDSLVIATEFDESGLDRSVQSALSRIQRFTAGVEQASRSLPEIVVSTDVTSLDALRAAFDRFIGEARDLEAFPDFTTEQSQQEIAELIAAFPGLQTALRSIDPSGVFSSLAQQARAAATEIQQSVSAQQQVAQGTNAASTALVTEASAFRQARESATTLTAALSATGAASRVLAAQGTQPVGLNVQPALNAADTLIGKLGLVTRSATSARAALATPLPPTPADPNLARLARGYQLLELEVREADRRLSGLRATMIQSGQAARVASGANAEAARALGSLGRQGSFLANGLALTTQQASKLRSGLTGLAIQATGAAGPVGQLAQSVLLFGGTGAVAGVAVTVAGLAAAYRFLTTAAREAREEQDRLVQSLLAEANNALPKAVQAQQELGAALESERRARESLARLRATPIAPATDPFGGGLDVFTEGRSRRQIKAIQDADRAQRQAQENQKRGVLEFFALNARTLTESITLRRADSEEIGRARGLVTALLGLERDTTLTVGQRLEIHQQMLGLQKALTAETERGLDFWRQFRATEEQILDARAQLARLGFGDPSDITAALTDAAAKARDLSRTEEDRLTAVNRLNAAASALIAPLERQVQATRESADNVLRTFRATQSLEGLGAVLSLMADTSDISERIAEAERRLAQLRARGERLPIGADTTPILSEIAIVEARLARLRAQRVAVTLSADATDLTGPITEAEQRLAELRRQGGTVTLAADASQILREMETVEARLANLRGQQALIAITGADTSPLARQIADLDAALAQLRASGAQATEAFRQLAQQRTGLVEKQQEAEQLAAEFLKLGTTPLELNFETTLELQDPDKALADLLKELQRRADERAFSVTLKALRVPVEIDTGLLGDAERATERLNAQVAQQDPIWREANAQAAKMLRLLNDGRPNAERLTDSIQDVTRGLNSMVSAASNVRLIGDEAARAIGDVLDLGDAIGAVIKEASTGNILGLVGAGINLLGGLFGGGESEHDRIVRENTEAIERNTAARSDQFAGLGGLDQLGRITRDLLGIANIEFAGRLGPKGVLVNAPATAELNAILAEAGVSLEQFAEQVKQVTGLDILDKKGRIVAETLEQLGDELLAIAQASIGFRNTLDDLTLASDLRARISGDGLDPTAAFQRELEAAGKLGGSAVTDFFTGLDLGDPEQLRKGALGLLDAFESGALDAKKLGKLTREDILRILGDAAGLIESLGQSAADATAELSIIPRGFRSAALAFEAQIPGLTPVEPPPPITVDQLLPDGLEIGDAQTLLKRMIPEPIQISGADLLDRLVEFGAIPATATAALPVVPGDGATLPQIAATLVSSNTILAQIAASLARPEATTETSQRETIAVLSRLADLLAKAKLSQTIETVNLTLESNPDDPDEVLREVWRRLDDLRMADLGTRDPFGPS